MKKDTDLDKLTKKLQAIQADNEVLRKRNIELEDELRKEIRKSAGDKILLDFHQNQFTAAAADLLTNPDPIKLHGTYKGKGLDFFVDLMSVVLVTSKGRVKELLTVKPVQPIQGGQFLSSILTNNSEGDFDKTLYAIQGKGKHLLRVNKSVAVNIHYYDLADKNELRLNLKKIPLAVSKFKTVKTDKFFNGDLFLQRKHEMETINRYKNQDGVT